jgi:hypothetical protein
MAAHPHKLMRAHTVGKKNVILNRDVPRERNFVRKNIIVADHAVVRDVHSDHEKVSRTDARRLSLAIGPMKRAELANDIVVADLEESRLTLELHILRLAANHCMLENAIPGADSREALDDRIGSNLAIRADFDVILDDRGRVN